MSEDLKLLACVFVLALALGYAIWLAREVIT